MDTPKMIIFDFAQTLVDEKPLDVVKGTEAVLAHSVSNPNDVTLEEVSELSNELFEEMVRQKNLSTIEVHTHHFQNYLYEYFKIEFNRSPEEIESIFEDAASEAKSTPNIEKLLEFLYDKGIRTGVISNMSFSGKMLTNRINRYIPTHNFEFIISSSEYVFRKPHKRIFELALKKAHLKPEEVWYCGDNPICDVDGSADSGLFPVWYKGAIGNKTDVSPSVRCLEINNWNEMIEVLTDGK